MNKMFLIWSLPGMLAMLACRFLFNFDCMCSSLLTETCCLQLGFGSGFKVNSAVWVALRSFQDDRHEAWSHVGPEETEVMWGDLEGMGVKFVDGIMPVQQPKKK